MSLNTLNPSQGPCQADFCRHLKVQKKLEPEVEGGTEGIISEAA